MLVCNVSLRPPRSAIAATIAEAATAADATATGNVVFATLVDDPASVSDTIDAYLGEIMLEAASAADAFGVGLEYVVAVDEATTADSAQNAALGGAAIRSAMVMRVFVNSGTVAREANAAGVMVNI